MGKICRVNFVCVEQAKQRLIHPPKRVDFQSIPLNPGFSKVEEGNPQPVKKLVHGLVYTDVVTSRSVGGFRTLLSLIGCSPKKRQALSSACLGLIFFIQITSFRKPVSLSRLNCSLALLFVDYSMPLSANQRSASSAAAQPEPAAVTA